MSDDERHAELDRDASARLDELIEMARAHGHATGPAMFMSNAIRVLYSLATGEAALVVREGDGTMRPLADGAPVSAITVRH